jgi:hypothetical protein
MRRDGGRILYSPQYVAGFASTLATARSDLHTMSVSHRREMIELNREVEKLRREVAELRALAGLRDPNQPPQ